jgi:hypothetical protein
MQKNSPPGSGLFFGSRALSTFGDEVWEIALPIYFALAGFAVEQVGVYYSLYALGTVLGVLDSVVAGSVFSSWPSYYLG